MGHAPLTAFPETEERLRELIRAVDRDRFETYRRVSCASLFHQCHGICCSLKVAVTREEIDVLRRLREERISLFQELGIDTKKDIVVVDSETKIKCLSKKRRPFSELNKIIHGFLIRENRPNINFGLLKDLLYACIFLLKDGTCALQRISECLGPHKWFYKPINCWKYPLGIAEGKLILPDPTDNRHFPCHCGEGLPARETLGEELAFLSRILHRDLLEESREFFPRDAGNKA